MKETSKECVRAVVLMVLLLLIVLVFYLYTLPDKGDLIAAFGLMVAFYIGILGIDHIQTKRDYNRRFEGIKIRPAIKKSLANLNDELKHCQKEYKEAKNLYLKQDKSGTKGSCVTIQWRAVEGTYSLIFDDLRDVGKCEKKLERLRDNHDPFELAKLRDTIADLSAESTKHIAMFNEKYRGLVNMTYIPKVP